MTSPAYKTKLPEVFHLHMKNLLTLPNKLEIGWPAPFGWTTFKVGFSFFD